MLAGVIHRQAIKNDSGAITLKAIQARPSVKSTGGFTPKDQSNRRKRLPQYAVWEIHPVMALDIVQ
jgi:hypothetical protein